MPSQPNTHAAPEVTLTSSAVESTDLVPSTPGAVAVAGSQPPAYVPTFNLPALTDPAEAMSVMQDNLSELGGNLKFDRVKIPSGGGISFETIDENGDAVAVTEIVGVVYDHYPVNAYWQNKFTGENNPPDCSSTDGVYGTGNEAMDIPAGQACATCPHNQWGSDPDGGKGKACKNVIRIYITQAGNVFPLLLTLPPTSTGNWREFIKRLSGRMKSIYGVVTRIKLEKDKSEGGILYSKAIFSKVDDLSIVKDEHGESEKDKVKKIANGLKFAMRAVTLADDDYIVSDSSAAVSAGAAGEDQPY